MNPVEVRDLSKTERVELLLKMADASWRDYNERRAVEWKANFALWSSLGAFGGFAFQRDVPPSITVALLATVLLVSSFAAYVFLWKREIQRANRLDLNNARYYWTTVDQELGTYPPQFRQLDDDERKWRPTHIAQMIVTMLFVLLACLGVWAPR